MFDTTKKGNTKMYHQDQIRNKGFMVDRLTTRLETKGSWLID